MQVILGIRRSSTQKSRLDHVRWLPDRCSPPLRLNGICPYYTMFPLAFPFRLLRRACKSDWVLDPFCGRGTTIFAARFLGLSAVGIDSNPVAAAIAGAKLSASSADEIKELAGEILTSYHGVVNLPIGDFWHLCYHPNTLTDICKLRTRLLERCRTQAEVALRALLLGILHGPVHKQQPTYLSNQMPRTYATKPHSAIRYWKKHRLKPKKIDVLDAISRRASFSFAQLPLSVPGRVFQADSRSFKLTQAQPKFRWVITSPPYYGMRSYFPDQWLRNWFLGGPDTVSYSRDDQLPHTSEDDFVEGLAAVWTKAAVVCHPDAKLVVRFGALPSVSKEPQSILTKSIQKSESGWRITTVKKAGTAQRGRRQYEQFGSSPSDPIEEIDLYACLEG